MHPPVKIAKYVDDFVKQNLWLNTKAVWIPCSPIRGAPYSECFSTVAAHIRGHGGQLIYGWAIWERPKVFIEGEFHAIWKSPDGQLYDLSPRPSNESKILFAPDPEREYHGFQVDNIRQALTDDIEVHRYLELAGVIYEMMNEGEYKFSRAIPPPTAESRIIAEELIGLISSIDQKYGTCPH